MKESLITKVKAHEWFYPLVLLSYVLALFFPEIVRPGVVSAVVVTAVVLQLMLSLLNYIGKGLHNSAGSSGGRGLHNFIKSLPTEDIIMTLWLIFNLLSGISCISSGIPAGVFLGEVFTTALPMCFYYCGRRDDKEERFSL